MRLRTWLPELGLGLLLGFFALRELGTFPAAWEDDGLFMIVARNLAEGRGYMLPILGREWLFPYVLGIGPTILVPVAAAIKLFGFSVAAARIPMIAYLALASLATYVFTKLMGGRTNARFATLLLITLSAFVNTGKPVMGEVPAFAFVMLGLLTFFRARHSFRWSIATGILFGLAALTKLSFALVFPSLGLALIVSMIRRDKRELLMLLVIMGAALAVFVPWKVLEMTQHAGLFAFIERFTMGSPEDMPPILFDRIEILWRMVYGAFALIAVLGGIGFWTKRKELPRSAAIVWGALVLLFIAHFLNNEGWFRHLLPAHMLLLPFVPAGATRLLGKRFGAVLLFAIALAQGYWQFDHRGSSRTPEASDAAAILEQQYADTPLIIRHSEVFVRLSPNPNWGFLPLEEIASYSPAALTALTEKQKCVPEVWKRSTAEWEQYGERLTPITGRFVMIKPENCE